MKRYSYIIIFIFAFLVSTEKLFSIVPTGLYFTPKFVYTYDGNHTFLNEKNELSKFHYAGGGFSLGYNLASVLERSPVRFEVEYLRRTVSGMENPTVLNSFLTSFYYDINFIFVDYDKSRDVYVNNLLKKRPLFSIYFGLSLGGMYTENILNETKDNKFIASRSSMAFGAAAGFSYNVLRWMSIDLGYRFLTDPNFEFYHEVLFGIRFMVPKIYK